ncbi:MAG TPA: glucosidase [Thermoanaerobaculia bacterium]|nr:glucosidase [Thermoanaerobaculia bacterium]
MNEKERLAGDAHSIARWRRWGPYLSDRAWGTVREDYSATGEAWDFLPHDLARSKAYRWGEDGIAGFCDRYQILCWSLAVWNERDPILKERYFGLVPSEGNHGEDVKECYFYLDALPSHAYQRMLYKVPQREYPYVWLIEENRRRGPSGPEFELIDTGIFDENRYFDVEIEIAKEAFDSIVFRVTAHNRGPERAPIHLLPQLWFRNTWAWSGDHVTRPEIRVITLADGTPALLADDSMAPPLSGLLASSHLGPHVLEVPAAAKILFTDNETNGPRVFGSGATSHSWFVKDAFHRRIVNGEEGAVNPAATGTKSCAWLRFEVDAGTSASVHLRLRPLVPSAAGAEGGGQPDLDLRRATEAEIDAIIAARRAEADEFYAAIHPKNASAEERNVQRQAFAGMLWSKQSYLFDIDVWLDGDDPNHPPPAQRQHARNSRWRHLNSMRILSMPDKWEYPWFAAWDLAFQSIVLALIDVHFAKEQLWLLLFEQFQHPNGQIPAYEWEFSDLNPPVHAWAIWRVYNMDRIRTGAADRQFLEKCFHKLLLNFTWWVNKVDREGNNIFEGGFLGLDNITVFDRSAQLPGGATLEQSDATGWMGMFSLVMMRISLELAQQDPVYEGLATKFFEHYVYIGAAMKMIRGDRTLWDEHDGFFYDLLRLADGSAVPFAVRSLVGLIPLYAIERLEGKWIEPFPVFRENLDWFMRHRPEIVEHSVTTVRNGDDYTHVLAVVDQNQLQHLLSRVVDPDEFLSPHGLRSLSKFHQQHPFTFGDASVGYEPAEAKSNVKGGNSNWRGPVWFPTSFLMIESLRKLEKAFGGGIQVSLSRTDDEPGDGAEPTADPDDAPDTGAASAHSDDAGVTSHDVRARGLSLCPPAAPAPRTITMSGLAARLAGRMIRLFLPDADGYRAIYGPRGTRKSELFAHDPHWKDLVLFFEYFHGDTGEGLGASHQTGWTGLVASLIDEWRG